MVDDYPPAPGGILALDLASVVGWAYGHLRDNAPRWGTWHLLRDEGEGARYASFENELDKAMARLRPSHMVLEATLPLAAMNHYGAAAQAFALRGIALSEAWRARCSKSEVDVHTVRREVMGMSRVSADIAKREVLRACRERGWKVTDHNAGDACLTWEWYVMRMRGSRPVAGPLWRNVA